MPTDEDVRWPQASTDERETLLGFLVHLRNAILRKLDGLSDQQARWTPDGKLICLLGIVNHLTHVEWRWINGAMCGEEVSRHEEEFHPEPALTLDMALDAYRARARSTDEYVRSTPLTQLSTWDDGKNLRWVLLHLVTETARHAGHADATRELLDGVRGQ